MGHLLRLLISIAAVVALCAPLAESQTNFPRTLPQDTVYGRLGVGTGPGQAIPFATLGGQLVFSSNITPRAILVPAGETINNLPNAATRASKFPCFDSVGQLTTCVGAPGSGQIAAGTGITFTGTGPTTLSVNTATLTGTVPIANGGTGQATALAARAASGLNIEGKTSVGNTNYTILSTDRLLEPSTTFSAARTWTLPAANSVNPGHVLTINPTNGINGDNNLIIARAGSDTIFYNNVAATSLTLRATSHSRQTIILISNGGTTWWWANPAGLADQFFASGRPWCDVRSQGAVGDNSHDDTTAINSCLTIVTAFGGGMVFFPPGNYRVTSAITIATAAKLVGAGYNASSITASGDFTVLIFGASSAHSSLDGIWVVGNQSGAATADAVTVAANMPIYFSNCRIWGGNFALNTAGIDGSVFNCFICGTGTSGGCINSTGANWYDRVKADTIGFTVAVGYQQGTNAALMENHWINSDFSGSFSAASVRIQDTNNLAVTAFVNSVFSNALTITGAKHTQFGTNEFGVAVASSASLSAVGNLGLSALTWTGAGARSCAGNTLITC